MTHCIPKLAQSRGLSIPIIVAAMLLLSHVSDAFVIPSISVATVHRESRDTISTSQRMFFHQRLPLSMSQKNDDDNNNNSLSNEDDDDDEEEYDYEYEREPVLVADVRGRTAGVILEDLNWRVQKLKLEEANKRRFLKSGPRFLPYEECRKWVQAWGLRWESAQEWREWIASGEKRNSYIPSRPDEYFTRTGHWISWEHFLGLPTKDNDSTEND